MFHNTIKSVNGTYSDGGMNYYTFKRMNTNSECAKILLFIAANPGITRRQVQDQIYGNRPMYSSFGGCIWRFLLAHNMIKKNRNGNMFHYQILPRGDEAIKKILTNIYKVKGYTDIFQED